MNAPPSNDTPPRIVVLISGRGSNMEALAHSSVGAYIHLVLSNRPDAKGLDIANSCGIDTVVVDHQHYGSRVAFEQAMINEIDRYHPSVLVLAGFMRVLTPLFIRHYQGRMINIHPALLPAFQGLNTHERAIAERATTHGCTVHFVDEGVDTGAHILQGVVEVLADDTPDTLAKRVLLVEHLALPTAIYHFIAGNYSLSDGVVVWKNAGHLAVKARTPLIPCGIVVDA